MFKVNDVVRVVRCEGCPGVVGREGRVTGLSEDNTTVKLSFGKGRPQRGRPENFPVGDLALVTEKAGV
jgi:hypothetical protein